MLRVAAKGRERVFEHATRAWTARQSVADHHRINASEQIGVKVERGVLWLRERNPNAKMPFLLILTKPFVHTGRRCLRHIKRCYATFNG